MAFRFWAAALAALAALTSGPTGWAQQAWPTKPIRLVIGYASGGPTDTLARTVAEHLTQALPQPTVVENKPGAAGNLGAETAAKSAPDGHTLFLGGMGPLAINTALYDKLPYDLERDWAPITVVARIPFMVTVNNDLPVKSLAELVSYAKANRGKMNHSTPGVGSGPHLTAELFKMVAGFDSTSAQYRSSPLMLNAVMQGEVQWMFDVPLTSLPAYKSGKVRVLATTASQRLPQAPEIATMAELGYPELTVYAWFAMAVPAATPTPIVERLNAEIRRGLTADATKQRLANLGFEPAPMTPEETSKWFADERARWTKVIVANGIKGE
jgi:tripartite-type tricarboxylate transporter receptor subunit TctC